MHRIYPLILVYKYLQLLLKNEYFDKTRTTQRAEKLSGKKYPREMEILAARKRSTMTKVLETPHQS